jgi:hypothetical protein
VNRDELQRQALEALRDERYLEQRHNHRAMVVRRAVIFTPGAIVLTGLLVYAIMNLPGSIVMTIIVGIAAIALDIETIAVLRDLRSEPTTTRGLVQRSWTKARFLVFGRVHYLLIKRRLFEVDPLTGLELRPDDEVEIQHWPHSNVVVTVELIQKAEQKDVRS